MRYLVTLSYRGTAYWGWQKQVDAKTIQGEIERVLSTYFNTKVAIQGSGRTDRAVHALGQTFHFDAIKTDQKKLLYALNKMLPEDINLLRIKRVSNDFHARYNVKEKVYRYIISTRAKEPLFSDLKLFYPYWLDENKFRLALAKFVGVHNYQSFTSKPSDDAGFVREIFDIRIKKSKGEYIVDFFGTGFMQGQIRMMIGTALALASDKIDEEYLEKRLEEPTRMITSHKVSGQGLYLIRVKY